MKWFRRLFSRKPRIINKNVIKFEEGKSYIFSKKRCYMVESVLESTYDFTWPSECDGKEVNVLGSKSGECGNYGIDPRWCYEVEL